MVFPVSKTILKVRNSLGAKIIPEEGVLSVKYGFRKKIIARLYDFF